MNSVKIIAMIAMLTVTLVSQVSAGDFEFSTDLEVRNIFYQSEEGKKTLISDARIDLGLDYQFTDNVQFRSETRFNADTAGIHQDVALDNRSGTKTIASIREAYIQFRPKMGVEEFVLNVGKKIMQNSIKFDFAELNPLARRDQSEPFSVMDNHTQDGVLSASIEMQLSQNINLYGECVIAGRNNPVLATSSRDHWTRGVPQGMSYGDPSVGSEVNYYCRMWQERESGTIIEIAIFHGSASGVDHVAVNDLTIDPVFAKETSVSVAADFTLGEWVARLGCNVHMQESSDDFAVCVAEADRIWQFDSGATLFVEMGYVNSLTLQDAGSIEELDMRRALDNHLVASAEYAPSDSWLFRATGAQSLEREDYYLRLEAEILLDQIFPSQESNVLFESAKVTMRGEIINGDSQENSFNTIFGEHSDDQRIMLMYSKSF